MKKLLVYYMVILAPFLLLAYSSRAGLIENKMVAILFFFYFVIYRNLTDYYRLLNKNIIKKEQFWDIIKPFGKVRYYRDLYLA